MATGAFYRTYRSIKKKFGILFGIFLYKNAFYNSVEGIFAEGTRLTGDFCTF